LADGYHPHDDAGCYETAQREPAGPDGRAYRRTAITIPVEIDIGPRGVSTRGTTVNLSRGGALVSVRHPIEAGQRCTLHFPLAGPRLVSAVAATVVRVEKIADGNLVALAFDDELPEAPGLP